MKEITLEITDYCPHACKYCSSNTTVYELDAGFLSEDFVKAMLGNKKFDRINISGGEPLAHPRFYYILELCKQHTDDVVVYTNALTHIRYNSNVIYGIYVEANLTVLDNVKEIHMLKRVQQGREKTRPEVKFSKNFTEDCTCNHTIIKPDGSVRAAPCRKEAEP